MNYIEKRLIEHIDVYHDLINAALIQEHYKVPKRLPHEWYFLDLFYKVSLQSKPELAYYFIKFVTTFYPSYNLVKSEYKDYNNFSLVVAHCKYFLNKFTQVYKYQEEINEDTLKQAFLFGEIVTDFMIKFCDYSLIKCQNQNIIVTSSNLVHKRFEHLISIGYRVEKRAKVYYNKDTEFFYKLPTLPTIESDYKYEEIIETNDGKFEKLLCLYK